jgi:hypothetical protein
MAKPKDLNSVQEMLDTMVEVGALDLDTYYKCLVELASDHASVNLDVEKALILINKCPPGYFEGAMVQQMKADRLFLRAAMELSHRLYQLGTHHSIPQCNMQPAEA